MTRVVKEVDYEAAYKDLNRRIKILSKTSSAACRLFKSTQPFSQAFDEMYDLGDCVLRDHTKEVIND